MTAAAALDAFAPANAILRIAPHLRMDRVFDTDRNRLVREVRARAVEVTKALESIAAVSLDPFSVHVATSPSERDIAAENMQTFVNDLRELFETVQTPPLHLLRQLRSIAPSLTQPFEAARVAAIARMRVVLALSCWMLGEEYESYGVDLEPIIAARTEPASTAPVNADAFLTSLGV